MAKTIPLIRAAVLFPMIRWLDENDHCAPHWLAMVGLGQLGEDVRERPIPLLKAFELSRILAAREGPDICARLISSHSLEDLGVLGRLILSSRTPREALTRIVHFLPHYSTHEIAMLRPITGGLRLQAGWSLPIDEVTMHLTQQFTAALIVGLCLGTKKVGAFPQAIKIRPHPDLGLDHLRQIFGEVVTASDEMVLSVDLDDSVLDAPLQFDAHKGSDLPPPDWILPQGEGSFSASVSLALEALGTSVPVRINHVAALAGMSTRTFQRLLIQEGTSFRKLLDGYRQRKALCALDATKISGQVAARSLGFSDQSSLSRAVRRWTGQSPRSLRKGKLP